MEPLTSFDCLMTKMLIRVEIVQQGDERFLLKGFDDGRGSVRNRETAEEEALPGSSVLALGAQ